MQKLLLFFSFLIPICSLTYAQNFETNTIGKLDSTLIVNDTLIINPSDIKIPENDLIQTGLLEKETSTENQDTINTTVIDSLVHNQIDTVTIEDTLFKLSRYDEYLNQLEDSLYFENPDTSYYIIHKLNKLVNKDTVILNDTAKQAIQKLIDFSENYSIDSVQSYIESNILYTLKGEYRDTSLRLLSDSILNAIEYLLKRIPVDSINISFTNINNDSTRLKTAESEIDSVRLNLYDNRGEYGMVWVVKSDKNVFKIYLEDGIYIEKAHARKVVKQKLDTGLGFPKLRKVEKVSKLLPIWTFDGLADIRFNQGYISDSWSEGGESSISALSILKYSADYSFGKIRNLDTDIEYRLGYIQAGDNGLRKNDDKFEVNAKYGLSAFNNWYYSALLNFKSQLLKGYEYPNDSTEINISEFLSPAYLVFSLGLDYKPSDKLTVLISPITSKFTIVADTINFDQTRFGVGENEYIRKEIGAYVKAISKIKIRDNIDIENKLNFFTNYMHEPQNIDVDWEVDLKVKLSDYITMSINAHFIHDDDVKFIDDEGGENGARPQFKELVGVGFLYSF